MGLQFRFRVEDRRVYVKGPFCAANNEHYRAWGGVWEPKIKEWSFSEPRIEDLHALFGDPASGVVRVRAVYADGLPYAVIDGPQLRMGGYVLASRMGRDTRVNLADGVSHVHGEFPASGGSIKNPLVRPSPGSIFELDVCKDFAFACGIPIVEEKEPPNPFVLFSDEQLLAELVRRGASVSPLLRDGFCVSHLKV